MKNIYLQVQSQQIPSRKNTRSTTKYIAVKWLKDKDNKNILKTTRNKQQIAKGDQLFD